MFKAFVLQLSDATLMPVIFYLCKGEGKVQEVLCDLFVLPRRAVATLGGIHLHSLAP